MQNLVGRFVKAERLRRKLTRGQLAQAVGFRNLSKGANRITRLEREGVGDTNLQRRVVMALSLDPFRLAELSAEDLRQEAETRERQLAPIPIRLIARVIPGFYIEERLPSNVEDPEIAEVWARRYAERHHVKVCLQLSRGRRIWIDERGQVIARSEVTHEMADLPKTTVNGKTLRFL